MRWFRRKTVPQMVYVVMTYQGNGFRMACAFENGDDAKTYCDRKNTYVKNGPLYHYYPVELRKDANG